MRTFTQVLADIAGGRTAEELDQALATCVLAVCAAQKSGTLTLKLKITPNGEQMVQIDDTIQLSVPQKARGSTMLYYAEDGSLMTRDPRQRELPLREVATRSTEPPRRVATAVRPSSERVAEIAGDDMEGEAAVG